MTRAKVKPITPREVGARHAETLPGEVVEAFNELIAANWKGDSATVLLKEAAALIAAKAAVSEKLVYSRGWLDVEELFRKAGWEVEYDKAGHGETYFDAYFRFTRKR